MYEQSPSIAALAAALAQAQGQIAPVGKNCANPHLKNRYADLAAIREAIREPLAAAGLAVTQLPIVLEDGRCALRTMLLHASGEWLACTFPVEAGESRGINPMQSLGSALSYIRRYAISALLNLATEDEDDGHAASQRSARREDRPARRDDRPARPAPNPSPVPGQTRRPESGPSWEAFATHTLEQWQAAYEEECGSAGVTPSEGGMGVNSWRLLNGLITLAIEAGKVAEGKVTGPDGKRIRGELVGAGEWLLSTEKQWTIAAVGGYLQSKFDAAIKTAGMTPAADAGDPDPNGHYLGD